MPAPVRLRVGVLGAGRVGAVLGAALAAAGHEVVSATAVSTASRRRVERLLPQASVAAADEVVESAELVVVAVPDDALRALIAGLAATGTWRSGQLVVHTSGAHGISVLDAAAARGVLPFALHPVMTFAGRPEDLDRLRGASWGVTAAAELRPVAENLVVEMGGEPVWVPEAARPLYHAALTMGANHLTTLVNDAVDLLGGAGVDQPVRLIAPLLTAALDNALRLGDQALTGPVSRGDASTVATHLRTLAEQPDQLASYLALARRTSQRALASGRIRPDQAADIDAVLRSA